MGCSALSCVAVSTSPFKRVILPGRSPVPVRRRPCPPLSAFLPPSGSPVAAFRVNGVTQPVSPRLVPVTQHSVSFPVDPCRGVKQFATPPGDCTARPRVKAHTPFGHQLVAGWFRVFRYSSCRRERLCGRDVPSSWASRTSATGRWVPGRLRFRSRAPARLSAGVAAPLQPVSAEFRGSSRPLDFPAGHSVRPLPLNHPWVGRCLCGFDSHFFNDR